MESSKFRWISIVIKSHPTRMGTVEKVVRVQTESEWRIQNWILADKQTIVTQKVEFFPRQLYVHHVNECLVYSLFACKFCGGLVINQFSTHTHAISPPNRKIHRFSSKEWTSRYWMSQIFKVLLCAFQLIFIELFIELSSAFIQLVVQPGLNSWTATNKFLYIPRLLKFPTYTRLSIW